ncbi:MAG: serine hydrolase domain-containing protein [Chloroflexota bacterium]
MRAEEFDAVLNYYFQNREFSGVVLLAKADSIIYQRAVGFSDYDLRTPNYVWSRFRIASLTKPIAATIAMRLVERGELDLDKTVRHYIPNYPKKTGNKITVANLLSHSSGLPHYDGIQDFFAKYSTKSYKHDEFIKLFWDLDLLFPPGTKSQYSSFNYYLLGVILEKVTGKTWDQLVADEITTPLGLTNTGVLTQAVIPDLVYGYARYSGPIERATFRDMSTALATGDIYSTAHDLLTFSRSFDNNLLVSEESKRRMFRDFVPGFGYGFGWCITKTASPLTGSSDTMVWHLGGTNGFRSYIAKYVGDGLTIVMLSNYEFIDQESLLENIRAVVAGRQTKLPDFSTRQSSK